MQGEEDCARFCDVVRRHPCIWYKNYSRRSRRKKAWQSIASELGENEIVVRQKWDAYRDRFAKDMKGLPPLQPNQDITEYLKPEYNLNTYFKHCLFLGDASKSNLTLGELTGTQPDSGVSTQKELECARITDVVRRHPFIWYKFYPGRRKNNHVRWHREWAKVAAELGEDVKKVRKHWQYYRNQFVNNLKRLPKLQPGQDITEYLKPEYPKSRCFKYCLFVGDPHKSGLTRAELTGREAAEDIRTQRELDCARTTDVVRRHPFIWYKHYPERYCGNIAEWRREWNNIATELGEKEAAVKKRWSVYRTMFRRDMSRLPKLQPDQDIAEYIKPEYKTNTYFRYCLFLGDPKKSGLTPAQLNGKEAITSETIGPNLMLQNNEEFNINDSNDLEWRNMETMIDIEDDECMYFDEEIKIEQDEDDEFLSNSEDEDSVHGINGSKPQSELNDRPVTNYNDNSNAVDLKNTKSETEPSLYGNALDAEDDDGREREREREVEREKNIEFSSKKNNDLIIEEDQPLLMPRHQPTSEEYTNNLHKNDLDIMISNCSGSDNVQNSIDNRLDDDNDENSLFLRSLLPYFRQLNTIEQMQVRVEVGEIIMNALLNKKS